MRMVFFVGPQKAGTSWVDAYLRAHGGVNLPENVKETIFFEALYDKGIDWYKSLFTPGHPGPMAEVAPTYFAEPRTMQRIHDHFPNAKIVISVREPGSRTYSSYRHEQRYGFIPAEQSFQEAVEDHHLERPSYYFEYSSLWQQQFSPDQVYFIYQDDMADLDAYARRICTIIGVPFRPVPDELRQRINEADTPRNYLIAKFASKVNRLSRELGLFKFRQAVIDLGLKRLIYAGGNHQKNGLSDVDRQWLMKYYLKDDWQRFQDTFPRERYGKL